MELKNIITGMILVLGLAINIAQAQSLTSASTTSGLPSNAVVPFAGSCPAGWTEYTQARGRAVLGAGYYSESFRGNWFSTTYNLGVTGGAAAYKMYTSEMPSHNHSDRGRALADADGCCGGQGWGSSHGTGYAGGSSPFNNRQPYIALMYCRKL